MTNERAAQYLMEATFGNLDVLTAAGAEDIFEEAQRRAADKVGKEKDEYYLTQISDLKSKVLEGTLGVEQLTEKLSETSLEVQATILRAEGAAIETERLRSEAAQKQEDIEKQAKRIFELAESVKVLHVKTKDSQEALERQKAAAKKSATSRADGLVLTFRVLGAVVLFLTIFLVGYVDKFLTSALTAENQKLANYVIIVAQSVLAILGVSVLADKLFTGPLHRLRAKLYQDRMIELGHFDEPGVGGVRSFV